jgi:hypothetical protein
MAEGPTMNSSNWQSYFPCPSRARETADEIEVSRVKPGRPRHAIGERKGDEKHGAARKTAEKNTEDSRSVRGDAARFLNEWREPFERELERLVRERDAIVRARDAKRAMAKLIRHQQRERAR